MPVVPALHGASGREEHDILGSNAEQLQRATCAQAEYRVQQGEQFFMRWQPDESSGPDFRLKGRAPRLAPKAMRELAGSGLLRNWRTVRPPPASAA